MGQFFFWFPTNVKLYGGSVCVCVCRINRENRKKKEFAFHRDLVLLPVESNNAMTSQSGAF